jgi:hypothetical protein
MKLPNKTSFGSCLCLLVVHVERFGSCFNLNEFKQAGAAGGMLSGLRSDQEKTKEFSNVHSHGPRELSMLNARSGLGVSLTYRKQEGCSAAPLFVSCTRWHLYSQEDYMCSRQPRLTLYCTKVVLTKEKNGIP